MSSQCKWNWRPNIKPISQDTPPAPSIRIRIIAPPVNSTYQICFRHWLNAKPGIAFPIQGYSNHPLASTSLKIHTPVPSIRICFIFPHARSIFHLVIIHISTFFHPVRYSSKDKRPTTDHKRGSTLQLITGEIPFPAPSIRSRIILPYLHRSRIPIIRRSHYINLLFYPECSHHSRCTGWNISLAFPFIHFRVIAPPVLLGIIPMGTIFGYHLYISQPGISFSSRNNRNRSDPAAERQNRPFHPFIRFRQILD